MERREGWESMLDYVVRAELNSPHHVKGLSRIGFQALEQNINKLGSPRFILHIIFTYLLGYKKVGEGGCNILISIPHTEDKSNHYQIFFAMKNIKKISKLVFFPSESQHVSWKTPRVHPLRTQGHGTWGSTQLHSKRIAGPNPLPCLILGNSASCAARQGLSCSVTEQPEASKGNYKASLGDHREILPCDVLHNKLPKVLGAGAVSCVTPRSALRWCGTNRSCVWKGEDTHCQGTEAVWTAPKKPTYIYTDCAYYEQYLAAYHHHKGKLRRSEMEWLTRAYPQHYKTGYTLLVAEWSTAAS